MGPWQKAEKQDRWGPPCFCNKLSYMRRNAPCVNSIRSLMQSGFAALDGKGVCSTSGLWGHAQSTAWGRVGKRPSPVEAVALLSRGPPPVPSAYGSFGSAGQARGSGGRGSGKADGDERKMRLRPHLSTRSDDPTGGVIHVLPCWGARFLELITSVRTGTVAVGSDSQAPLSQPHSPPCSCVHLLL